MSAAMFEQIRIMPQEEIAAMKACPCGGSLRDEEGSSKDGAWAFRQCRVCLAVYLLRFLTVVER